MTATLCPSCGHEHADRTWGSICIGCPCEVRPDPPTDPETVMAWANGMLVFTCSGCRLTDRINMSAPQTDVPQAVMRSRGWRFYDGPSLTGKRLMLAVCPRCTSSDPPDDEDVDDYMDGVYWS